MLIVPETSKESLSSPRPHQGDCSAQGVVSVTSWAFRQDSGTSWQCLCCVRKSPARFVSFQRWVCKDCGSGLAAMLDGDLFPGPQSLAGAQEDGR